MNSQIFLSRKNLLILLSKLDRQLAGEVTECTIIKHKGHKTKYQQTMVECHVTAVENKEYYEEQQRSPGMMLYVDEFNSRDNVGSC